MPSFVPDGTTIFYYSFACIVLFITPGPDMSFFLAKTITGGKRVGTSAMLGACIGNLIHSAAAAFGLSALIIASQTAFWAVKIIGALYLLFMAYQALRYGSSLTLRTGEGASISAQKVFWQGLTINLSNPKVILFFITFLPQFVVAQDPHIQGKLLFLGVYMVAFTTPLCLLLIIMADRFIHVIRDDHRIMRAIDYIFASVFGFFALHILTSKAR